MVLVSTGDNSNSRWSHITRIHKVEVCTYLTATVSDCGTGVIVSTYAGDVAIWAAGAHNGGGDESQG